MQQKAAIKAVEKFLLKLQRSVSESGEARSVPKNSDALVMFSRQGKSVTLLDHEAVEYGVIADNLYRSMTEERRLAVSRKTIESQLQESIITALFGPTARQGARIAIALFSLSRALWP
jgi:hypothetical protein